MLSVRLASLLLASLLAWTPSAGAQPASASQCKDWQSCRDLAEQARAAGDSETFHDLAWRAVQTRGRRDPELFFLLARAQALSGRPDDALVTLQRLAQEMHVAKDVSDDPDFRRVRSLRRWPDVDALIKTVAEPIGGTSRQNPTAEPIGGTSRQNPTAEPIGGTSRRNPSAEPIGGTSRRNPSPEPTGGTSRWNPSAEPIGGTWEEVARFPSERFDAGGLAYDAVSKRFVIGNLPARKLTIVEEGTNRAATLSGDAAQLLNVRSIEIDRRQGDLWVVSEGSRDGSRTPSSELHKLQLVSGRVLTIYTADPASGDSRFVDVAIAPGSEVLVLDAEGPRLLRPAKNGRLAAVMDLPKGEARSLAPANDGRTVYVAYTNHIARVDLSTKHVDAVVGEREALSGFTRIRWHKGSLVGAQEADRQRRIVQLRLARNGAAVASVRILDGSDASSASLASLDVLEDDFFYLVPGEPQASIRRIRLK